jgi:hypothetical protein
LRFANRQFKKSRRFSTVFLNILDPFRHLWSTHPSDDERIKRIQQALLLEEGTNAVWNRHRTKRPLETLSQFAPQDFGIIALISDLNDCVDISIASYHRVLSFGTKLNEVIITDLSGSIGVMLGMLILYYQ